MNEETIQVELTQSDILALKDMHDIAIGDDVFDLDSYGNIERANQIENCWKALKIIKSLTVENSAQKEDKEI